MISTRFFADEGLADFPFPVGFSELINLSCTSVDPAIGGAPEFLPADAVVSTIRMVVVRNPHKVHQALALSQ
jgi:hypothetical protein